MGNIKEILKSQLLGPWMWSYLENGSCRYNQGDIRSCWIRVGPQSNSRCPNYKQKFRHKHTGVKCTSRQRGNWVKSLHTKNCEQLPETRGIKDRFLPYSLQRVWLCLPFVFTLLTTVLWEKSTSVVLSHSAHSTVLQQC